MNITTKPTTTASKTTCYMNLNKDESACKLSPMLLLFNSYSETMYLLILILFILFTLMFLGNFKFSYPKEN